mmetsp:Transcript_52280/g.58401  ORF Transcript_52280/g.58401 Transcript_52280/m.58401 type:complete len:105 (-) Transcript_52280:10-324(-)
MIDIVEGINSTDKIAQPTVATHTGIPCRPNKAMFFKFFKFNGFLSLSGNINLCGFSAFLFVLGYANKIKAVTQTRFNYDVNGKGKRQQVRRMATSANYWAFPVH